MAVVVTIAKGYDLGYIWKTQDHKAERTGGYYLSAVQAGDRQAAAYWAGREQQFQEVLHRASQNAILQPPKPEITPSARILQLAAEHDIEPEAGS